MTQKETIPTGSTHSEIVEIRKKEPIVQTKWWEEKPQDELLPVMIVLKLPKLSGELQRSEKYDLMNAAVAERVARINEFMAAHPEVFTETPPKIIPTTFGMLICRFTAAQCGVLADGILKERATRGILVDSTAVGAEKVMEELAEQLVDESDDE